MVWFILRLCRHDIGYIDGWLQVDVALTAGNVPLSYPWSPPQDYKWNHYIDIHNSWQVTSNMIHSAIKSHCIQVLFNTQLKVVVIKFCLMNYIQLKVNYIPRNILRWYLNCSNDYLHGLLYLICLMIVVCQIFILSFCGILAEISYI